MLNHRRIANNNRIASGLEGNLPWGPAEHNASAVREAYERMMDDTMMGNPHSHSASEGSEAHLNMSDIHTSSVIEALVGDSMGNEHYPTDAVNEPQTELNVGESEELLEQVEKAIEYAPVTVDAALGEPEHADEVGWEEHEGHDLGGSEALGAEGTSSYNEVGGSMSGDVMDVSLTVDPSDGVVVSSGGIDNDLGAPTIYDESQPSDDSGGAYTSDDMGDWADDDPESEAQAKFRIWAGQNRGVIDLFIKHGLTYSAMDDILALIEAPYKTWKTVMSRIREDSGLERFVEEYPVCPGHMLFYDDAIASCYECGKPRCPLKGPDAHKMSWLPLKPRLQDWFLDEERCSQLYDYMTNNDYNCEDRVRDVFDADVFQRICEKYDGAEAIQDDIFLAVSADGFQAFRKKSYDIWPIVAIICNLPPHLRFAVKNMLPLAFIPGPTEPTNLQSFFEPLIREIEDMNAGGGVEFTFFDGVTRRIRVHIMWFAGDLPAVKKMSGIKGHNGKRPCRFCLIAGIWSEAQRHTYYPSKMREDEYSEVVTLFDIANLPLRTVQENLNTISELAELSGRSRADLQIATGITEGSVAFRLPSIIPYASFPIDIMHLFYNIGKDMIRLWCSGDNEDFVLSRSAIQTIDEELYAFGDGIASQMRC